MRCSSGCTLGLSPTSILEVSSGLEVLLAQFDLKSYARHGARARLRELAEEAKQILTIFPDLSASVDEDELPVNFILRKGARKALSGTPVRRRRRGMSAAQRKAVSARMKKYWAERRKTSK